MTESFVTHNQSLFFIQRTSFVNVLQVGLLSYCDSVLAQLSGLEIISYKTLDTEYTLTICILGHSPARPSRTCSDVGPFPVCDAL